MAEKKQRRERLSARDHQRAVTIVASVSTLVNVLVEMYPADLELRIAHPALLRFMDATQKVAAKGDEEPAAGD